VSFEPDLEDIILRRFKKYAIECNAEDMDARELLVRYCEMLKRHIAPVRRTVHLSNEIHYSLEKLSQTTNPELHNTALEARDTVFQLQRLLSCGGDVTRFLSKHIKRPPEDQRIPDKLLWDFGMHHFHLCRDTDSTGFVRRSDYLLFAHVTQDQAYFVDVRPHRDPQGLEWVHQDLLKIIYSNWPELVKPLVISGVTGVKISDEQKKELRRKNANHAPELGGQAVRPLGGGIMMDGSSTWCRLYADRLFDEIRRHQDYFDSQPSELHFALENRGVDVSEEVHFDLELLDDLDLEDAVRDRLKSDHCLSKGLCSVGLVVVERKKRLPIVITNVYADDKAC